MRLFVSIFAAVALVSGCNNGTGAGGPGGASGGSVSDAGVEGNGIGDEAGLEEFATGLHELFMHDVCTGVEPTQPDTCLHDRQLEEKVVFGGDPGELYEVTLRVRGLFEPTIIGGGRAPLADHPYFVVGGTVEALDWSHWHIEVEEPAETYWLNHYPSTSHTIYQEDFEATIVVAGGSEVAVRVIDGNDRQIDNAEEGLPDRRQLIQGVTDEVLDGQMLRLDVVRVEVKE